MANTAPTKYTMRFPGNTETLNWIREAFELVEALQNGQMSPAEAVAGSTACTRADVEAFTNLIQEVGNGTPLNCAADGYRIGGSALADGQMMIIVASDGTRNVDVLTGLMQHAAHRLSIPLPIEMTWTRETGPYRKGGAALIDRASVRYVETSQWLAEQMGGRSPYEDPTAPHYLRIADLADMDINDIRALVYRNPEIEIVDLNDNALCDMWVHARADRHVASGFSRGDINGLLMTGVRGYDDWTDIEKIAYIGEHALEKRVTIDWNQLSTTADMRGPTPTEGV
ncbi:MAG: hypothetical protein V2I24_14960 [Halieaceae bacterium]|jgi:hypothetical protein|nr:hypothetical protein [Halieaceae bacterium]